MNSFKNYLDYLKDNPEGYWFKRKIFGWGWTPARSQGWIVMIIFIGLLIGNSIRLDSFVSQGERLSEFLIETILLILILLVICYKTGEKPKWMWGLPKEKNKE